MMERKRIKRAGRREKNRRIDQPDDPIDQVFEEMGMMKISGSGRNEPPFWSVAFEIGEPDREEVLSKDAAALDQALSHLLNGFPEDVSYQFLVVNKENDETDFLRRTIIPESENKEASSNKGIHLLNETVTENAPFGHNNTEQSRYIIFSVRRNSMEEALQVFRKISRQAADLFEGCCGIRIRNLQAGERQKLINEFYQKDPECLSLKSEAAADEDEQKNRQRAGKMVKSHEKIVLFREEKSHILLNGNKYVKVFFINNFPTYLSDNLISELTAVSSTMVYSAIYEPLLTSMGFEAAERETESNLMITDHYEKRTLADRKANRVTRETEMAERTEDAYFTSAALKVLGDSQKEGTKVFACSFLIALYSDHSDDLERDSRLLNLAATKFAFQLQCLDYHQKKGLDSMLPLCHCSVDIKRIFPISKLCKLNPMDFSASLREDGLYAGINSVNCNIILVNRKNASRVCGLITGNRNAGKTFQVKRELFNALISTDDTVVVLSDRKEEEHYSEFVSCLGGKYFQEGHFDPIRTVEGYGIGGDGRELKNSYYLALFAEALRIYEPGLENDRKETEDKLKEETAEFSDIGFDSLLSVKTYMEEHVNDADFRFPLILRALQNMDYSYITGSPADLKKKLLCFETNSAMSLLIVLEKIWNLAVMLKKKSRPMWIFIDSADAIIQSPQGARYLKQLLSLSNGIRNPMTLVIQNAARFGSGEYMYNLKSLFPEIGYYKLLNQGPIERRMFAETLNISGNLLPYITNSSVGSGLIISQSSNIPFTDNMGEVRSDPEPMMKFFEPLEAGCQFN